MIGAAAPLSSPPKSPPDTIEVEVSSDLAANEASLTAKVGFWSAVAFAALLTAVNLTFAIMILRVPATEWRGMEVYARTYRDIAFVPQTIGLVSIPALILMLVSIHVCTSGFRRLLSMAGLAFGIAFATLLGSLYFIQVGILWPALEDGAWAGLDQGAFANPRSLAWGLDHFAWSLLGVALLFMAWAFEGHGLRRWLRWLFVLNGVANVSLAPAFAFRLEGLTLGVAFFSWVAGLPITAFLVAVLFRNIREKSPAALRRTEKCEWTQGSET